MESKDELIKELRGVITELRVVVRRQAERNLELELAKVKKDSSTSSNPHFPDELPGFGMQFATTLGKQGV